MDLFPSLSYGTHGLNIRLSYLERGYKGFLEFNFGGYKFEDEPFTGEYLRGTVAMANSGPNTNGSQFFIMHQDQGLPKNYIIFGQVTQGLEVVDTIATSPTKPNSMGENSTPVNPISITEVLIEEK